MSESDCKIDLKQFGGHTPGPWQLYGYRAVEAKDFTGEWKYICEKVHGQSPIAADANARLIAAAPDLLAQLAAKDAVIEKLVEALKAAKPFVHLKSAIGMNGPNTACFVEAQIEAALALAADATKEGL